jgi:hypothetical protein
VAAKDDRVSRGEDTVAEKKLRYVVEQVPDWLPTNRSDIANGKGGNSAILDVRYVLQIGAGGIQAMLTAV